MSKNKYALYAATLPNIAKYSHAATASGTIGLVMDSPDARPMPVTNTPPASICAAEAMPPLGKLSLLADKMEPNVHDKEPVICKITPMGLAWALGSKVSKNAPANPIKIPSHSARRGHIPKKPAMTAAVITSDAPDSYARKALIASAVGYAMDGFDLLILGFMLGDINKDLGLTPAQGGSLVTMTLVGAVVGGIVFGMLSDRFGRIRVLTWTILIFAIFTGLCAFAQGY